MNQHSQREHDPNHSERREFHLLEKIVLLLEEVLRRLPEPSSNTFFPPIGAKVTPNG
jgi:hypothetical protein